MSRELIWDHLDTRSISQVLKDAEAHSCNQALPEPIRQTEIIREYGSPTLPMPWYKRKYHRWVYKLKKIVEIIKE